MNNTVINVFDKGEADKIVQELVKGGFAREDITVVAKDAGTKNLIGTLADEGVPEEDAKRYSKEVSAGKTLVYVKADDDEAKRAVAIMERRSAAKSDMTGKSELGRTGKAEQGKVTVPVVEEELQVGKREVERGGVRIHRRVTDRPVEETVRLREERVNVERRPVNRAVGDADLSAIREGTFDVTATAEEAVVSKQERVVEEVAVGKEVAEQTETVRDTVRRTDVDVEQVDADRTPPKGKSAKR